MSDSYTAYPSIIKATSTQCEVSLGSALHGSSLRNVDSWTAIVVRYITVGDLEEAKRLFNEMLQRNAASWNAIIGGLVRLGEVLILLEEPFHQLKKKKEVQGLIDFRVLSSRPQRIATIVFCQKNLKS
ncbi:hypothetical protein CMV_024036 [Castanea mollissima]|uniref:Pentatricopeptide repeat-containing protein n=1 Tax=Castanea mollissima TaxID=60419 RepID=A0A8J4VID2_9ROSI|nr:hypothetical protein CMV_024036 [Castanea mollissima]